LRECLSLRRDLDERWGVARTIEALAWVEASRGGPARSARLLGAADAMNERLSAILSPNYQAHHNRCVASVRGALTEVAFRSEFAAGHVLSWSQAVDHGLRDAPVKSKRPGDLTSRQREIANFVAGGLTNRDIASRLSLAERTVDAHLEHIMNKLGYHSRSQIAAWVARRGTPAAEI
jgi:non-specific serine/threonine protein kinase